VNATGNARKIQGIEAAISIRKPRAIGTCNPANRDSTERQAIPRSRMAALESAV